MDTNKLKRTIGLVPATTIGLGAMLGAGIFVFPGLAGGYAGFAAIISFFIGGLIALLTAVCTAELSTAMPQSGGGYYYISRSFGPFWGSLIGMAQWIGLVFASAFYLVAFGEYALSFLVKFKANWSISTNTLSFCFALIILAINIVGTKKVGRFQNIMVISLTLILVLIFTYGLIDYLGFEDKPMAFSEITPAGIGSIFTTTGLIFTSYIGFVQIANIGSEIKNPSQNLPRALIGSVVIAMTLNIFIMTVCVVTFSQQQLKVFGENATIEVARELLGNWGTILVLLAALLAALSSANASVISASRSVFALSKDKVISPRISQINTQFGTPHIAIILVTAPIAILLVRQNLQTFAEVASFLHLIIYAGICLSVLKLRVIKPTWYVPTFRIRAAKTVAGLGATTCLTLACLMQTKSILIGLGVLLFLLAYCLLAIRKKDLNPPTPEPPHIDKNFFKPNILIPIDIEQEQKTLPHALLDALPDAQLLLLGYKETPEQTSPEQSEEEFGQEAEKKLEDVFNHLQDAQINFDCKTIFSKDIKKQIKQLIEDNELQFVLTLKSLSTVDNLIIPIYDSSQINRKLSTLIHTLHAKKSMRIKVLLLTENQKEKSNEAQLKQAIANQMNSVNITISDYQVQQREQADSFQHIIRELSDETDLIIWSEPVSSERDLFLSLILEQESKQICSPIIMILNQQATDANSQ